MQQVGSYETWRATVPEGTAPAPVTTEKVSLNGQVVVVGQRPPGQQ
jgi:hypothetical protein